MYVHVLHTHMPALYDAKSFRANPTSLMSLDAHRLTSSVLHCPLIMMEARPLYWLHPCPHHPPLHARHELGTLPIIALDHAMVISSNYMPMSPSTPHTPVSHETNPQPFFTPVNLSSESATPSIPPPQCLRLRLCLPRSRWRIQVPL
jgi:hypothetical protein